MGSLSRASRAFAVYAFLTAAITWPMVTHLHIMDAGDSAFFAWAMGWEIHCVKTNPGMLPHANIFHPLRYALGLDEAVLGTTILAFPLSFWNDDPVWLLNVARLLTYVFSGLSAYLLARELKLGERAALIAGAAFAFSLVRCNQFGHVSTLGTQWLPFVVLFVYRFARTARIRDAVFAGLFYVLETYACGYHGLMAVIILPVAALPLLWGRWSLIRRALPGVLVAALGLVPFYLLYHLALTSQNFVRSPEETVYYSASLETFLAAPWWSLLYGEITAPFRSAANNLFLGLVPLLVIAFESVRCLRERRRPSLEAAVFIAMAMAAIVVAFGPEVRLFGHYVAPGPYGWLRAAVPIFQNIRVNSRAGIFLALAAAMLLGRAISRWESRRGVMALLAVATVAECAMVSGAVLGGKPVVDTRHPPPRVYTWLAEQPGDFAIVELPIQNLAATSYKPAFHESIYMLYSTVHWKRLLNGYSGPQATHYVELRDKAQWFPSQDSIDVFRRLGARYVVVHRGGYGPFKWARIERELPHFAGDLRPVASFDDDQVFELVSQANLPEGPH